MVRERNYPFRNSSLIISSSVLEVVDPSPRYDSVDYLWRRRNRGASIFADRFWSKPLQYFCRRPHLNRMLFHTFLGKRIGI